METVNWIRLPNEIWFQIALKCGESLLSMVATCATFWQMKETLINHIYNEHNLDYFETCGPKNAKRIKQLLKTQEVQWFAQIHGYKSWKYMICHNTLIGRPFIRFAGSADNLNNGFQHHTNNLYVNVTGPRDGALTSFEMAHKSEFLKKYRPSCVLYGVKLTIIDSKKFTIEKHYINNRQRYKSSNIQTFDKFPILTLRKLKKELENTIWIATGRS